MSRVEAPATKKAAAPKKMTAREKRIAQATQGVAASGGSPARRGEADEPETATPETHELDTTELEKAATAAVPHQADTPEPPKRVYAPHPDIDVQLSDEAKVSFFTFVKPPEDLDPLEQMGMARRGIARATRGLENGMGQLQKGYVGSAGEYLWWATQGTRLKDAGFKSIEKFAEPLGLTKQDVYRLRRAVPVYRVIGDLVDEALNERTIRELFSTLTDEKGEIAVTKDGEPDIDPARAALLREQFGHMKKIGRVNSGGAVAARKLLMLGEATDAIEPEPGSGTSSSGAVEQLAKARRTNRLLDLEVLREAKKVDPAAAQEYVDELRRKYEAAAEIVG